MKLGNIFFALAVTVSMLMTASCDSVRHCDSSVPYDIQNGRIVFQTPTAESYSRPLPEWRDRNPFSDWPSSR